LSKITQITSTCLLVVIYCIGLRFAIADELHAKLVEDSSQQSPFIILEQDKDNQEPVISKKSNNTVLGEPTYFVVIKGHRLKADLTLLYNNEKVTVTPQQEFSFEVPLESENQNFNIVGIDNEGNVLNYNGGILFPQFGSATEKPTLIKKLIITPSLSLGYDSNQQTGVSNFSQLDLGIKLGGQYLFTPDSWGISFDSYSTFLPLTSNQPGISSIFLEADIRVSRMIIINPSSRWAFKMMVGWTYLTSFTSFDTLGFKNAYGPELYPEVEYRLSDEQLITLYLKYVLLIDGGTLFSINNSEFAIGGDYSFLLKWSPLLKLSSLGHWLNVSFDLSNLALNTGSGSQLYLTTFRLSGGYQFRF
jgi:hypothetical protein